MPIDDSKKDKRILAIQNNSCGMCRALGRPICMGHGGGAGGGSSSNSSGNESSIENKALGLKISTADINAMKQSLLQGQAWDLSEDSDLIFEFTDSDAVLGITLDMGKGLMVFRGKRELTEEEQKALDELYSVLGKELNFLKNELLKRNESIEGIQMVKNHNTLTVKIPNPRHYDLFVQQLLNKNLLPTQSNRLLQQNTIIKETPIVTSAKEPTLQENQSKTPTPINIHRGPKPPTEIS